MFLTATGLTDRDMRSNNMDISRTYTLSGEYLKDVNTCVFSLVEGVTLRALVVRERQVSNVQDN